jgi:membrane protein YdbS with pleckstrin-like domain
VYLLLAAGWLSRVRRVTAWLLLGWGWLHAIGGGLLSVLPLPLWPYQPEQSLRHYAVHALYAVLQVPLLVTVTRYLRRLRPTDEVAAR